MHRIITAAGLAAGVLLTGSEYQSCLGQQAQPSGSGESMTFSVASSATSRKLEGVEVLIARKEGGLESLGRTGANGSIVLPKPLLRGDGVTVIVFCKEDFFCGAFRLDEPKFFEAKYRLIDLAPFSLP